jgi:hypothetical protein
MHALLLSLELPLHLGYLSCVPKKACGACGKIECGHVGFARLSPEEREEHGRRGGQTAQAKYNTRGSKKRPHRFTSKTAREARQLREEQKET